MESTNRPVFFGEWLKIRRKALDLTQSELAQRAGCSVHALRKIESGERRPSKQLAELLANALEIPAEDRSMFVRVARGELIIERLRPPTPIQPAPHPTEPGLPVPISTLPETLTQLIGRERELTALSQLLHDPQCRLLTLIGPGGIGKTRLAIEVASQNQNIFPDGAYFVSLASINSPTFLVPTIAGELGIMFQSQIEPRLQLLNFLQAKKALLILDNFEHLLDGIDLLADILEHAPRVRFLVTSRERLNMQGEWVFAIQGLPVPTIDSIQNADDYSSIALFKQSAGRTRANLKFAGDDLQSVVRICQAVEGMPLGIELAAAWVPVLTCGEIAQEIEHSLDFLATSMRDVPARQRSLRAAFNHSWNLLSEDERRILQELAIFQGCFSRRAAEEVVGASLLSLLGLVSKSLIRRTENGCFDLHEVIRQYALAHLRENPNKEQVYERHSDYYLAFLGDQEEELKSHAQREAIQELTAEIDNLHAAWSWAVNHERYESISGALRSFGSLCDIRGWLDEGIKYLDLIIHELRAHPEFKHQSRVLGQALSQQGLLYFRQGKFHHAQSILEESISILSQLDECKLLTDPLIISGIILFLNGEIDKSQIRMDEGLTCARQAGDQSFEAYAIYNKGYTASLVGHYNEAYAQMLSGLALWRELGDPRSIALGLNFISPTAIKLGYYGQAHTFLEESLKLCKQVGDRWGQGTAYRYLGLLALVQGNLTEAESMLKKSLDIFSEFITGWDIARSMIYLGEVANAANDVPEAERIYLQALTIAMDAKALPLVMDILAGLADLYSRTGDVERAIKLSSYAMHHYATTQETKDRADQLLIRSKNSLTTEQMKTAKKGVQERSLEDFLTMTLGIESTPATIQSSFPSLYTNIRIK